MKRRLVPAIFLVLIHGLTAELVSLSETRSSLAWKARTAAATIC